MYDDNRTFSVNRCMRSVFIELNPRVDQRLVGKERTLEAKAMAVTA